jgi:hypothetical protein
MFAVLTKVVVKAVTHPTSRQMAVAVAAGGQGATPATKLTKKARRS